MAKLDVQTVKQYRDTNGILYASQKSALLAQNEIDLVNNLVNSNKLSNVSIDGFMIVLRECPELIIEWVETREEIHNDVYSDEPDQ
jgi:hypothetical protein